MAYLSQEQTQKAVKRMLDVLQPTIHKSRL